MFNVHHYMYKFYDKHVRLDATTQRNLTGYRNTNIEYLESGLKSLGFAKPAYTCDQGSYAMHTMTQRADNDYDIDTALIFDKEELPDDPKDARLRVLSGIEEGGRNFSKPPEARDNAVTVWYAEGHHIDLPVFRRYEDPFGSEIVEHAGPRWTPRDPTDITQWFKKEVETKSPTASTVEDAQMRRIVQLLKVFGRSRSSWALPGGLLISVLVAECYRPDNQRDDLALYNTMSAIASRLRFNVHILNPVDCILELTDTNEHINEVKRFGEKLTQAAEWLKPLFDSDCNELKACEAWNECFKHDYWAKLVEGLEAASKKSIYVESSGFVSASRLNDRAIPSPEHRFFGHE